MNDLCPACQHERGRPHGQPWYVRLFGLRARAAFCREPEMDPGGWTGFCGCEHPFHGS